MAPVVLALAALLLPARLVAAPIEIVVEIDAAAERLVEARVARRLVPLELADVRLPETERTTTLFFRVLGRSGAELRVELWVRGEYHGARTLTLAAEAPQLAARRVALACAELGRRLVRKRTVQAERSRLARQQREAAERERAERAREGPRALRAELFASVMPDRLWLAGSRLAAELSLRGPLRLDVAGEMATGRTREGLWSGSYAADIGPSLRAALSRDVFWDFGAAAGPWLLRVPASGLSTTEAAAFFALRGRAVTRLQLRVSPALRIGVGLDGGVALTSLGYSESSGARRDLARPWLGGALGVVVTPPH